jgi:arylsulfatase A-like enzyme
MTLGGLTELLPCAAETRPTSFVFFLVDDLGWKDLACYGSEFYETPHVDRLAAQGVRFTNAYAACPVCSPTRVSIQTGKYPARLQTTDWFGAVQPDAAARHPRFRTKPLLPAPYLERMPLEEVTLAEALGEAGYATFFAGKWHLGPEGYWPEQQGYQINRGGWSVGAPNTSKKYFSPYDNPRLENGPPGEHLPDRLASETSRFIRSNRDRPFLAFLSFYSVHTPLMTRQDLEAHYVEKARRVTHNGPRFLPEGASQARQVQDHAIYGGMVHAMDLAVGKVLDAIEAAGVADSTVVVFMSDNGGLSTAEGSPTSNLPLRAGKGWMYEGGIREPMIIKWPGHARAGTTCDHPVTSTDFFPTLLEMAGLPLRPEQHLDGMSLVPLLVGDESFDRGPLFWHYPHYGNQGGSPTGAVRDGDWKLIEFFETGDVELYDLSRDPGEQHDLAGEQPDRAQQMRQQLAAWQAEIAVRMPSRNPQAQAPHESSGLRSPRRGATTDETNRPEPNP